MVERQAARVVQFARQAASPTKLVDELAVGVKHLHAVVARVADPQTVPCVKRQAGGSVELAGVVGGGAALGAVRVARTLVLENRSPLVDKAACM